MHRDGPLPPTPQPPRFSHTMLEQSGIRPPLDESSHGLLLHPYMALRHLLHPQTLLQLCSPTDPWNNQQANYKSWIIDHSSDLSGQAPWIRPPSSVSSALQVP